jgi:hypothetical protein
MEKPVIFFNQQEALDFYFENKPMPDFKTTIEYEHFLETEVVAKQLKSGREYFVVSR